MLVDFALVWNEILASSEREILSAKTSPPRKGTYNFQPMKSAYAFEDVNTDSGKVNIYCYCQYKNVTPR